MDQITDVRPGQGFTLYLCYDNAVTMGVDLGRLLMDHPSVFASLADRVYVESGMMMPNGGRASPGRASSNWMQAPSGHWPHPERQGERLNRIESFKFR